MGKKGKKGKKKGSKKAGSKADKDPLSPESAEARSALELSLLKSRLTASNEEARKSAHKVANLSRIVSGRNEEAAAAEADALDATADIARQYKGMQAQLMARISQLQALTDEQETRLEASSASLVEVRADCARRLREKDDEIAHLNQRLLTLESSYEQVLNEALDAMAAKVETANGRWAQDAYALHEQNAALLADYGISNAAF